MSWYNPIDWAKDMYHAGHQIVNGDFGDALQTATNATVGVFTGGLVDDAGDKAASAISSAFGPDLGEIGSDLTEDVNSALSQGQADMNTFLNPLQEATTRSDGTARTIGSSLDEYDAANRDISDIYRGGLTGIDAGKQTQDFLNPMSDYITQQIAQANRGSAGAALQSSATNNAVNKAVANAAAQNWNTANTQALQNARQNLDIANTVGTGLQQQSENVLTADTTPQQDMIGYQMDWNTNNLQSKIDLAKLQAQIAAGEKGWLEQTGDFVGTLANAKKLVS